MPRLRRSDCAAPGIQRRRRGRGFEYVDPGGERVDEPETLERIRELAIPPAWKDVWICLDPLGHLQATGIDAAGRKQYRYHDRWRARRDREKFDSMLDFARALPDLRARLKRDLRQSELNRPRVLACSIRLLDLGFFRIGSEDYAETNESYGLATMRRSHVTIDNGQVIFDYPSKSGQRRVQAIADEDVRRVVAALKRRRSRHPELLAYRNGQRWVDVRSEDINAYLKEVTSGDFTSKDFRTWNATVLAAVAVAADKRSVDSQNAHKRVVSAAVKTVATFLGNTAAVARASYIDPRVFDRLRSGWTIAPVLSKVGDPDLGNDRVRARIEAAVLDLLEDE